MRWKRVQDTDEETAWTRHQVGSVPVNCEHRKFSRDVEVLGLKCEILFLDDSIANEMDEYGPEEEPSNSVVKYGQSTDVEMFIAAPVDVWVSGF